MPKTSQHDTFLIFCFDISFLTKVKKKVHTCDVFISFEINYILMINYLNSNLWKVYRDCPVTQQCHMAARFLFKTVGFIYSQFFFHMEFASKKQVSASHLRHISQNKLLWLCLSFLHDVKPYLDGIRFKYRPVWVCLCPKSSVFMIFFILSVWENDTLKYHLLHSVNFSEKRFNSCYVNRFKNGLFLN